MSGYLEVKYPSRSNLGLNPFKSWKRQWCILRPSPTCSGGGSLAVYCSEAGAPAGTIELPAGCIVRRAKSRTRPHAFAVFTVDDPRKPRILLSAQSLNDSQTWMDKIRGLLNGSKLLGTENLLKDTYSVTVVATELSRICGLNCDTILTLSATGLHASREQKLSSVVEWKHIRDVLLVTENANKNKTCVLIIDSGFSAGAGELKFSSPLAGELAAALRHSLRAGAARGGLSRSDGDLRARNYCDLDIGEARRSSWYSGPSEVSLDDIDLVMSKEWKRPPRGQLARCSGEGHLAPAGETPAKTSAAGDTPHRLTAAGRKTAAHGVASFDDSMSDRRSLLSVASGIYEEIPDEPPAASGGTTAAGEAVYCAMRRGAGLLPEEPAYESVAECVYGTMRRTGKRYPPPPLPPRLPFGTSKLGESWNSRMNVPADGAGRSRHGSLGSLPRCKDPLLATRSLPKFNVFRKRLKSDSRVVSSPKSETSKENKDIESKKKRFDFTPTRDIFKSFKVSRKMKNLKISSGLAKGETKSCEFLDETEHVTANRCSKSVECLEDNDEFDDFDADLSIEFSDDAVATLALPQEIVDLILRGREYSKIRLKEMGEGEYLPMSPVAPPLETHYMVMSPRGNLA